MRTNEKRSGKSLGIIAAVTYAAMVGVNALANTLPINGIGTGEVSDSYPNLFAPAGITFSIWGLIYLLLAGYTLYQLGLFRGEEKADREDLYRSLNLLFIVSSIANILWIFAWHYLQIALSVVLMLVILVCLIFINEKTRRAGLRGRERLLVRLPFSIYFGWITVATIANITTFLVSIGWTGGGIPGSVWTMIVIIVGLLIGGATMARNRDIPYGLVIVWAYGGILLKHTAEAGFAGAYPGVIMTAVACMVLLLLGMFRLLSRRRKAVS